MKIFLSHSTQFDYICELYDVIKSNFDSSEYSFLLPEELKVNTKEFIRNADIFFCEISFFSYGVGIETGWADAFDKPIYCFYKKGINPPSAFKYLTGQIYEYSSSQELVSIIGNILKEEKNKK